jgi:predicted aconitase
LHAGDLAAVDARFEPFTLTSDAFRNLSVADCELVEEFARQILPKLSARDVKSDITCVPYQTSGSRFMVRGQILRALPRAEQSPGVRGERVN